MNEIISRSYEKILTLEERSRELRRNIIKMIYRAKSGHPGSSLSIADILSVLYFDQMKIDPSNPLWAERDRLILSKGHACPALYACLAMRGFFETAHLETLRSMGSILQGHPNMKSTPGVDMTTGSLGQGLSTGVGMALDNRISGSPGTVYVILGDGELNEGQVWEAAMAAGKYRLHNLIAIVDRNQLQLDGTTEEIMPLEPLDRKFEAFNWRVLGMDGHDIGNIVETLEEAQRTHGRPCCIIADTVKGKGVSFMEGVREWHGKVPDGFQYDQALLEIGGGKLR